MCLRVIALARRTASSMATGYFRSLTTGFLHAGRSISKGIDQWPHIGSLLINWSFGMSTHHVRGVFNDSEMTTMFESRNSVVGFVEAGTERM
jgi:hypothetical protein